MNAAGDHRMVLGHDDHPLRCSADRRTKSVHNLLLGVGGAAGVGIQRLGSGVEPPLRVQQDETQTRPDVGHCRARASSTGLQRDHTATH
jgi:hypothetical protein